MSSSNGARSILKIIDEVKLLIYKGVFFVPMLVIKVLNSTWQG